MAALQPAAIIAQALKPSSLLLRLPHALRATYASSFLLPAPAASLWRPLPSFLTLPALTIPTLSNLGSIFGTIWDGLLLAVPKKKPSKSKSKIRRNSQGKAYKDVENLVSCSSCGRPKRMHVLCPYCVQNMRDIYDKKLTQPKQSTEEKMDAIAGKAYKGTYATNKHHANLSCASRRIDSEHASE